MAAGEEIEPAIHVDDSLAELWPLAAEQLLIRAASTVGRRTGPKPDVRAGVLRRLVGRVQLHSLLHRQPACPALFVGPRSFLTSQGLLEGFDEVALGAEQHAADEVGGGNAGGPLDDLETVGRLDEPVAVLPTAVGRDVVAVDHVLAAKVADPI